jgi:hypothetical protein
MNGSRCAAVVHAQAAGSGEAVVRDLAHDVCRTAVSVERRVRSDDRTVSFRYTESQTGRRRLCALSVDEFLRRHLGR